jgi:hypothetical protein
MDIIKIETNKWRLWKKFKNIRFYIQMLYLQGNFLLGNLQLQRKSKEVKLPPCRREEGNNALYDTTP